VGKKAFAEALAMSLLCESPRGMEPCGVCKGCHWFAGRGHPDYKLIEPAENAEDEDGAAKEGAKKGGRQITINEIRGLGEFLALASHQGGWRVVVLHPAEAMNPAAANALLKTLEEPPARVLLVLVSHQPRRLLPTVRSRCRKLALPSPPWDIALGWLRAQCVDDPEPLLREAGGAPLMAMEFAEAERRERRERFIDALAGGDPLALSALAQDFQARQDEAWGWMTRWTHDLMRVKQQAGARYFPERADSIRVLAERATLPGLMAMEDELRRAGRWLRHPLNTQLLLESWLLRYGDITRAER
jgi:DNA polymerase-3 subunit delta'